MLASLLEYTGATEMGWLNRTGMILAYLSFWLMAPELLGEERIKRFQQGITAGIRRIPVIVAVCVCCAALMLLDSIFDPKPYAWAAIMIAGDTTHNEPCKYKSGIFHDCKYHQEHPLAAWVSSSSLQVVLICIIVGLGMLMYDRLNQMLEPVLSAIAKDQNIRYRCLLIGAATGTAGFIMQLVASFQ